MEQHPAYNAWNYRLPIRASANTTTTGVKVETFICPSDTAAGRLFTAASDPPLSYDGAMVKGNYAGIWSAAGGDFDLQFVKKPWKPMGMFGQSFAVRAADIQDGLSNCIAAAEVRISSAADDCRGVWALGVIGATGIASRRDDPNPDRHLTPNKWPADKSGDLIPFCNSSDPKFPCTSAPDEWDALQPLPQRTLMRTPPNFPSRQGAAPRSEHPGGVMTVFADGSTRFISDNINAEVWHKLLTIKNQDPTDDSEY
jgi:hypothetical protein